MTKFVSLASAYSFIPIQGSMAKYTNQQLIEFILNSDSIDSEAKSQLIRLLRNNKKYGIVWEDNPEEAYEYMRYNVPVFKELPEKFIPSNNNEAPNHILIEGDNLHAISTLCYAYEGKLDVIYIDPPYNSGARDWKYNNDYVDGNDSYRHSKWLSLIYHRLKVAKRLLNPTNSVLIVTIDEKEYLHLGCLLEELFPEERIQMVSSVINTAGATRENEFARTDEYLFFVFIGEAKPQPLLLDREWLIGKNSNQGKITWDSLKRAGSQNKRSDSPGCFYPIFVSNDGTHIVEVGDALPLGKSRKDVDVPLGSTAIWPMHPGDIEGRWQTSPDNLKELIRKGFVKLGKFTGEETMAISYLKRGEQQKVESHFYEIIGHREDGSIIVNDDIQDAPFLPGTQWNIPSHNAKQNGTILLSAIIGKDKFPFPKSLYAVHDALRFFVADKPNALILDFFAGSGTTLHATMDLNKEDGGKRRCILVTNNENNICEEVTYLRNKKVIQGYTNTKGKYVEGLTDNTLRYFQVKFLSRTQTHQNKRETVYALTDLLRIKENCFIEQKYFGTLLLSGKEKFVRYFAEGGNKMLVIYEPRVLSYIVNEIKAMDLGKDELKVYIFADGAYPYTEDFRDVLDKISLVALPYAFNQALKHVLPSADDINIDTAELSEEEKEALISSAIESESNE